MEIAELFLDRHAQLHGQLTEELLDGLSDRDWRARPHGVNSIAWLVWHVARCEDGAVNRHVAGRPQLLDREPWAARMNVPLRHRGTAMTSPEVDDLTARVDVTALRAYWDAAGAATRETVEHLPAGRLDEIVTVEERRRVLGDEGFAGSNETIPERPPERKRHFYLTLPALAHGFGHFYEGLVTKGLIARTAAGG